MALLTKAFNQVLGFDVKIEIVTEDTENKGIAPIELDENTATEALCQTVTLNTRLNLYSWLVQ